MEQDCSFGPSDCPCQGNWNDDETSWELHNECNASCDQPVGYKVMKRKFDILSDSNPIWCSDIDQNADAYIEVPCFIDASSCPSGGSVGSTTEFFFTGSYIDVNPTSTGWIDCVLIGGSGGNATDRGGKGVRLLSELYVTRGQPIRVIVGHNGTDHGGERNGAPGGSGTAILMKNGSEWFPVLVAGGGGGGAHWGGGGNAGMPNAPNTGGAYGGTLSGGGASINVGRRTGESGFNNNPVTGGNGGEGSAAPNKRHQRHIGPFGYGKGGDSWFDGEDGGGGGGGGGYTGGGGGGGAQHGIGGAGGSSFVHSDTSIVKFKSWEHVTDVKTPTLIRFG